MIQKVSNISFKSTPIYDVKIKKLNNNSDYENVNATFSKLDYNDKEDVEAVKNINKNWGFYVNGIGIDFSKKRECDSFYAIELKGDEPLKDRIVFVSEISKNYFNSSNYINYLQSCPEITDNDIPKYKGVGEVMLCGIAAETKKEERSALEAHAAFGSEKFYLKSGFFRDFFRKVYLPKEYFDDFISKIEDKYDFKLSESEV